VTTEVIAGYTGISEDEYKRRIRAWTLYDWANSAFFTTVLAAVLPVYYSQVAGSTLGSPAQATQMWSITLSVALFVVAVISPVIGTISDIRRGKKKGLALFVGIGVIGTGLLALVGSGDWVLASILVIIGRVGVGAAMVFYEALLPHVARPDDLDRVSTRGYAVGYLGGGLLLAVNIAMIFALGDEIGSRLSFLTVAIWWAVFSIPILRRVPEPPAAVIRSKVGSVITASFRRLGETFRHLRRYRQLLRFLIAFLIYNDGIGTIIGVAVIYGAELGFGSIELIAAILMVQFVGIPFSLVFGRIPSPDEPRRAIFLAFVVWNVITLPLVGIVAAHTLDGDVVGAPKPALETEGDYSAEGEYTVEDAALVGDFVVLTPDELPSGAEGSYAITAVPEDVYAFAFNGQKVVLTYSEGPDRGRWAVFIDGVSVLDDDNEPLTIDGFNETARFELTETIDALTPDWHVLTVVNTAERDEAATGTLMAIGGIEVLETPRSSNLGTILGLLLIIQLVGLGVAWVAGASVLGRLADTMTTKRTIILALVVYTVIAIWGFFLDAVIEFWYLAWLVAVVQGGSQALSRSLYAGMSPTTESGEFFGFFSVMSKFSAILGPLVFALAVGVFGSSRPAILFIASFFIVGIALLLRVDVDEGRRVAHEADVAAASAHLVQGA
jgi:UMF1 family MFS transporter